MRAYAMRGQHQQALKAFEDCRRVLQALHAISPSPQTQSLRQKICDAAAENLSVA